MKMKQIPPQLISAIPRQLPIVVALATSMWLYGCNSGGSGGGGGTGTNTPPVVNAGTDQTATAGASVQLVGSGSDTDGSVSFHWEQTGGPNTTLSDANIANPTFVVPAITEATTFIFVLTVTDSSGATSTDEVTIVVSAGAGGGGGGATSNRRISRLNYDLDNNGTIDAVRSIDYDSDGRIVGEEYIYTDDGVADTNFGSFSIDGPAYNQTVTYSYTSAGLLAVWSTIDSSGHTDMVYDYGVDALVDQLTLETYNSGGALVDQSRFNLTYTANSLSGWEFHLSDNTLIQSDAITYNTSAQVQSDLLTQAMGGSQAISEYTFSATGKIDLIHKTKPAPSTSFFNNVDFEYDGTDRLTARVTTSSKAGDNYRWNYAYNSNDEITTKQIDLGSNGSVEATVTAEWEDGACREVFSWAPRAEPNFVADAAIPYVPGTGYAVIPVCGAK